MKSPIMRLFCRASLFAILAATAAAQLRIQSVDVAGDSISKAFNGAGAPCTNADQEDYNWITSNTHASALCSAGPENVFSFVERLECDTGSHVFTPFPNHAASGARLLSDLVNQANNIKAYLSTQPAARLAAVFLGHNDNCSGSVTKTNNSCSSADQDPNNYCRTRPDAFERELRKGLDILMSVPDTRVAVAAPVRVSQLCNFQGKANCQAPVSCQFLWSTVAICTSLTRDCSPQRIIDAYTTMKTYRDILKTVTAEYAAIPDLGRSRVLTVAGQSVGGGAKAAGTSFTYSDAAWQFRFSADQLSCCDCFHPSALGQDTMGRIMKTGLLCSRLTPCCRETGDPLTDAQCARTETKRVYYNGVF